MSDEKLGFTFYPKDWWTSDSFFSLEPIERYIFLEIMFMMYSNGGWISDNKVMVERRLGTSITDEVWEKISAMTVKDEDKLTMLSINKRLRKTVANQQNGLKGGRPKLTKNEADEKPKKPSLETHKNPPLEREYKENRNKREIEGELQQSPPPKNPLILPYNIPKSNTENSEAAMNDTEFMARCYRAGYKSPDVLGPILEKFNRHRGSLGKQQDLMSEYRQHFFNWIAKGGHKKTEIANETGNTISEARRAAEESRKRNSAYLRQDTTTG